MIERLHRDPGEGNESPSYFKEIGCDSGDTTVEIRIDAIFVSLMMMQV